ncbi:MAG TPA: MBL fold metallo-hydrolase [Gemmatimonadales bacterium]|jgi:glyoxylase-like metal-dependent hydrolase (beta-lactamase superfamily II)
MQPIRLLFISMVAGAVTMASTARLLAQGRSNQPLHFEEYVADSMNFHVVSTIISGRSEAILVDCQNRPADAAQVADRIAASGKRLKAIFITHPDHDHYTGAATILQRFPGTPIYMTPAAIVLYDSTKPNQARMAMMRSRMPPGSVPDSFPTMQPVPPAGLSVDGRAIEIIPDLQGDVEQPTNSALWIPSMRVLLAGDVVFRGVHPWLGASTSATRVAWRGSLDRLAALHPRVVIAGHKPSADVADTPDAIEFTRGYLDAFDLERSRASGPEPLIAAMRQRYPDATEGMLLNASAGIPFRPATPPPAAAPSSAPAAAGGADLSGEWSGNVDSPQGSMTLAIVLARNATGYTGTATPPSGMQVPLSALRMDGSHVVMTFSSPDGDATIDGTLASDNRSIAGTFTLGVQSAPLTVTRKS